MSKIEETPAMLRRFAAICDDVETVMLKHKASPVTVVSALTACLMTFMNVIHASPQLRELYVQGKKAILDELANLPE